jgi:hypothetical protein
MVATTARTPAARCAPGLSALSLVGQGRSVIGSDLGSTSTPVWIGKQRAPDCAS